MELTITQKHENPLLGRTEVYFTIAHEKAGTPSRAEIRKAVAGVVGLKGVVVLDWARSEYGRTSTRGYAKVYEAKERALELETFPVLVRNGLKEAAKKAEAVAAPTPPPPKREAPKAEPPKKEAPKPEPPKKEAASKKEEGAPKGEKREGAPAKKEAPAKEKKPAGKKEGK